MYLSVAPPHYSSSLLNKLQVKRKRFIDYCTIYVLLNYNLRNSDSVLPYFNPVTFTLTYISGSQEVLYLFN